MNYERIYSKMNRIESGLCIMMVKERLNPLKEKTMGRADSWAHRAFSLGNFSLIYRVKEKFVQVANIEEMATVKLEYLSVRLFINF